MSRGDSRNRFGERERDGEEEMISCKFRALDDASAWLQSVQSWPRG